MINVEELQKSRSLQAVFWVLLLGFLIAFDQWSKGFELIAGAGNSCPEYFQNCEKFHFLSPPFESYGRNILYTLFYANILAAGFFAYLGNWKVATLSLIPIIIWKTLMTFFLTDSISVPFEYFHIFFVYVLIFGKNKLFKIQIIFVILYLLAAEIKFDQSWIMGSYFSTLKLGLPMVPRSLIPVMTNFLIFLELATPVLLFSPKNKIRYTAIALLTLFHLYSGVLVLYRYPTHCLPLLLVLFIPSPEKSKLQFQENLVFICGIFLLLAAHFLPYVLQGDHRLTRQSSRLRMDMYDANRQCSSNAQIQFKDLSKNQEEIYSFQSSSSAVRCSPYIEWFKLKQRCQMPGVLQIPWTFDISINGEPFQRLVNVSDACSLDYAFLENNPWINWKDPAIVGFPNYNELGWSGLTNHPLILPAPVISLTAAQIFIEDHIVALKIFYYMIFLLAFGLFVKRLIRGIP